MVDSNKQKSGNSYEEVCPGHNKGKSSEYWFPL